MPQENFDPRFQQPPVTPPFPASAAPGYPSPAPASAAPRRSHAWIVAIVVVVALLVVTLFGMWSCSSALSSAPTSSGTVAVAQDSVGIITISGTIQYDGTTCSPEGLKAQLDEAASNDRIKAVVLRVDSGGGVATAGEEMATYVKKFRDDTGKPVVVSSASMNASAAYEISSQADYIFVAKTTSIGAIGTALQVVDYSGLMQLLGISVDNITSAESKDSTYGTRKLTDEERAYYQHQVDQVNDTFIQNVAAGRGMSENSVRSLATGLSFTGLDVVGNGLADEVGTKEDAVHHAAEVAGLDSYETVNLEPSSDTDLSSLLDLLSESNTKISADDLAAALKELNTDAGITQ